jgi:hypothetical protein
MARSRQHLAAVGSVMNVAAYREYRFCSPHKLPGIRASYGSRGR